MPVTSAPPAPSKSQLWTALGFAWELGYAIALPLVAFALIGRLADGRFGTTPLLFIAGIVLALAVTVAWMLKKVRRIAREIDEMAGPGPIPPRP